MINFPYCLATTRQCSRSTARVRRTRTERVRAGEWASPSALTSPPSKAASFNMGRSERKDVCRSLLRSTGVCSSASIDEAFRLRSDRELLSISSSTPVLKIEWNPSSCVPACAGRSSLGRAGAPSPVSVAEFVIVSGSRLLLTQLGHLHGPACCDVRARNSLKR